MMPAGSRLHDAQTTPDDKYAVLAVRSVIEGCDVEGKTVDITDGTVMVYDAGAKRVLEKQTSVCLECHKGMGLGDKNAVLCGIDSNYRKENGSISVPLRRASPRQTAGRGPFLSMLARERGSCIQDLHDDHRPGLRDGIVNHNSDLARQTQETFRMYRGVVSPQ